MVAGVGSKRKLIVNKALSARALPILFILASTVGCDQITKSVAIDTLKGHLPLSYLGNLFRFEYAENPGAFLSIGAGMSAEFRFWLLTVLVGVFLGGALIYLILNTKLNRISTLAMSLILGGGLSNLLDRIVRTNGGVVDFMNMGIGHLRTGIFNVADMGIMLGIFLLLVSLKFSRSYSDSSTDLI